MYNDTEMDREYADMSETHSGVVGVGGSDTRFRRESVL